ncbi:MAG: NAD-dependent epimerase/dehydratase family protein [Cellulomonas sp.]
MRVLLTGGRGMLGSAMRYEIGRLRDDVDLRVITRAEVDLRDAAATREVIEEIKPDSILHVAARVGGIAANIADPTGYLMDNLLVDTSVLSAAVAGRVPELLYFGSSCMYPRDYRQPLVESDVLAAPLEPTNEGYALAKISASRLCQYASSQYGLAFKTVIPSNLYGPHDDFSLDRGHLVAAALAKTHAAKLAGRPFVDVWGDGTARREFTYVKDLSRWITGLLGSFEALPPLLNVGCGYDRSVREFYELAREVVGYDGDLRFDADRPAGMHQKLMDSSLARGIGWAPETTLTDGMSEAYSHYRRTLGD